MTIRNFLFHRVSDEKDAMWPPMRPKLFERIIRLLVRNYQVISLEDYLDNRSSFKKGKKKLATVLFDDGYQDNIENAAPILQQFKCPASFYVVTDCIDRNIPTWTYILDHAISNTGMEKIELSFDFVPERFKLVLIKKQEDGNHTARELKIWLKKLPHHQRLAVLNSILEQCKDVPVPGDKMMSWEEVRQLKNSGFIIGSHSHTHPCLSTMADVAEIRNELKLSRDRIMEETGIQSKTISYPMNNYDERVMKVAKEEGYKYGLAVDEKFFKVGKYDLYAIPRSELHEEPWYKVQVRISGLYSVIKSVWT